MSETQVLMTVPNLFVFISRNYFLEGALLFNGKGFILSGGHGRHQLWWVGFKKNHGMGGGEAPSKFCKKSETISLETILLD